MGPTHLVKFLRSELSASASSTEDTLDPESKVAKKSRWLLESVLNSFKQNRYASLERMYSIIR